MNHCSRCSEIPDPFPGEGTLCLAPPLAHTVGTLRGLLRGAGYPLTEPAPNILAVSLLPGSLQRLVEDLGDALSRFEFRETRSIVLERGESFTLAGLARMQSLGTLVAQVRGGWLTELLRDERLISHFQPIVRADEPGNVFAYECLLRGVAADGSLVSPALIYQAAREADLMFPVDRAARLTAIRTAAEHNLDTRDVRLFINFNPTSIYDPAYCLRSTVEAVAGTALRPDRIVFEVVESDHIDDVRHLLRIVDFYRDAGFQVALDDLGSGFGSLNLLGTLKPDFVKLDMNLIRGVDADPYKARIVAKLLEMARDLNVATVAEGIETEGEWTWVRDHGADFVQGYYFARPARVPPELGLLQVSAGFPAG